MHFQRLVLVALLALGAACRETGAPASSGPAAGALRAAPSPRPVVVCQVLDDAGRTLAGASLGFTLTVERPGAGSRSAGRKLTDAEGRFRIELDGAPVPDGARRVLTLFGEGGSAGELDLSRDLGAGEFDCGVLVLEPAPAAEVLRRIAWARCASDDELEAGYRRAQTAEDWTSTGQEAENGLREMVRRGGERWLAFLRAELERSREPIARERAPSPPDTTVDLTVLTALRRAEGKRDPLAIEVLPSSFLTPQFPEVARIDYRLRNVDEGEAFDFRCDDHAQVRAEVLAPDGSALPQREPYVRSRAGTGWTGLLLPGRATDPLSTTLDAHLLLHAPGDYTLRLQYAPRGSVWRAGSVRDRIFAQSAPVIVRALPRTVRISRARHAGIRAWVRAVDGERAVVLLDSPAPPRLPDVGPADDAPPQDRLFGASYEALPALFEALDDPELDRRHRAWVLGLLWDIAGCDSGSWTRTREGNAFGYSAHCRQWPWAGESSLAQVRLLEEELSPHLQDELVERWRALRGFVRLELLD